MSVQVHTTDELITSFWGHPYVHVTDATAPCILQAEEQTEEQEDKDKDMDGNEEGQF